VIFGVRPGTDWGQAVNCGVVDMISKFYIAKVL